jgi:hypothetical protein
MMIRLQIHNKSNCLKGQLRILNYATLYERDDLD